jgi:2-polyprenyl-3-methyl-5-hydroxy-6-metoxy-1,4-benzoquinol methylase
MRAARTLQIGKVPVSYLSMQPDTRYSESNASESQAEDDLLQLFKSNNPYAEVKNVLSNRPSWPMLYHLSPQRGNIVSWYNFSPKSRVLEVGAGCGAVTQELVKQNILVTSLELGEKRSLVNAYRNKNIGNLKVIIGNLQEYNPDELFEYIVCVGVLEYASSFINDSEPYLEFLRLLKQRMKPRGRLLLAIENRLGLKYLAGAPEDHTGRLFEGLNGYPSTLGVQTFGRGELTDLLKSSGFSSLDFYYPFPDYKLPYMIFSDDYLPGKDCDFPLGLLPTPTLDQPRYNVISEEDLMIYIEGNGLFPQLSNSFLVVAR